MKIIFALLFGSFIFSLTSDGQKVELNKFLNALKTPEFSESQEVIAASTLKEKIDYYTLKDFTIVSSLLFKTDIPGISGYKSIVQANATNKAGTYKDTRLLVVQFIDKSDKKWKVYAIREAVDPCKEAADYKDGIAEGRLGDGKDDKKLNYRSMCYFEIMCGKLLSAKASNEIVLTEIRKDPSDYFEYEEDQALVKITGK